MLIRPVTARGGKLSDPRRASDGPAEGQGVAPPAPAYYRAACNRALAARQLNVHVNTLRYRLERIESLVGGPVDDPCRAVPLRVAILARAAIGSSVAGGAAEQ